MKLERPSLLKRKKIFIYLISFIIMGSAMTFFTNCTSNAGSSEESKSNVSENKNTQPEIAEGGDVVIEKATEVNDKEFHDIIKKGVVLVDFWAPWCAPCRMQGPVVDELAKEMGSKVKITKLNVDNNNTTSQEYDVKNIPTIIIFKDGKPVLRFVGVQDKKFLKEQIEQLL